jgi:orotidine-5'-phosphate decarboxylase
MTLPADDRLIVALDFATVDEARAMVKQLGDGVSFYKIGYELIFAGGLDLVKELKAEGKNVFLDGKVLDIGNTVEKAMANIAKLGVDLTNMHAHNSKTMLAGLKGLEGSSTKLLGVTVLTDLGKGDLNEQGMDASVLNPRDLVLGRAALACKTGLHGVVASGQEAAGIRQVTMPSFLIVTLGIRLPEGDKGDQVRITTPEQALRDGATHLVVGRPITGAANPRDGVWAIQESMARA